MIIGVGLIGTGYMGKCHALALNAVAPTFVDVDRPRLELLCDNVDAEGRARALGFARATADWRTLVSDPRVDIVWIARGAIGAITATRSGSNRTASALTSEPAEPSRASVTPRGSGARQVGDAPSVPTMVRSPRLRITNRSTARRSRVAPGLPSTRNRPPVSAVPALLVSATSRVNVVAPPRLAPVTSSSR